MESKSVIGDWLSRRKISESVQKEFGIRATNHPGMGECIVIPVINERGTFAFNKYRRHPLSEKGPKYSYDKGGSLALYGAFQARLEPKVLWTEGELDTLAAWSVNIPAVSGTGGAKSMDERWKLFFESKETYICFDNDKTGGEGAAKALAMVPHAFIVFLPDQPHIKDISDYVIHGGDLESLLKTAKRFGDVSDVLIDRSDRVALWKSTFFHDAYVALNTEKPRMPRKNASTSDALTRAKQYPIDDLMPFRQNKSPCPFHAEKDASLHYYREQNRTWCFGSCGRGYDAVDIYQKINNCSFTEAIRKLQ